MIEDILTPLVCERYLHDPHYREGHIRIIAPRPGTRILGLHTPEMKMVAKRFVKEGRADEILDAFEREQKAMRDGIQPLTHDERMIWGLVIDYMKCPLEKRLERIEAFLPAVDNWAICDNFCCNSAWVARCDHDILWPFLTGLSKRSEEFTIRVSLILAMANFLNDMSIHKVFGLINGIGLRENEPYYIRMAVAWTLATALAKQKEVTYRYLRGASLPADILKLYARKVRESLRTRDWPAFQDMD